MKRGLLASLLVVSIGVNIGFLLHWFWPKNTAVPAGASEHARSGWHGSSAGRSLDLDRKQVQLMENERRRVMAQAKPLQEELQLKRHELFLLLKKSPLPEAELDIALSEIARLQTAIEKMFVLHSHHMKGFFTPAQLRKYEDYFENGLCPGMMHAENCPPGNSAGQGVPVPACKKSCDLKK